MFDHTRPARTAPERSATTRSSAPPDGPRHPRALAQLQAAFRDLHGPRLHGFALLVALGDRSVASLAAAEALAAGAGRAGELRHPDRAAAWLRRRVVDALPRRGPTPRTDPERRAALRALGVADAAFDGLAALSVAARAAFVAGEVEGLDPLDVELIVDGRRSSAQSLLADARRRYLAAALAALEREEDQRAAEGELHRRVSTVAERVTGAPAARA